MKLLLKSHYERLLKNGRIRQFFAEDGRAEPDFLPIVKLFTPDAQCTWLLAEIDPDCPDNAFGLCDLGWGSPELGSVSLSELASARGPLGLPIERDMSFTAKKTISEYAAEARKLGYIKA